MFNKLKLVTRYLRDESRRLKILCFTVLFSRKRKKNRNNIDLSSVKKVALLRYDGKLGDAIMMCSLIDIIERNSPDIELTLFSSSTLVNEWVKKISGKIKIIECEHKKKLSPDFFGKFSNYFDVAVELKHSLDLKDIKILHSLNSKINIGYAKSSIFDIVIPGEFKSSRDRQIKAASIILGKDIILTRIPPPKIDKDFDFIKSERKTIAFNLFGANKYRSFSFNSAVKLINNWLAEWPDEKIILIPVPGKIEFLAKLESIFSNKNVFLPKQDPSLDLSLFILSKCDLCFTPDTSVVHMASALNTPTLAIYHDNIANYEGWKPLSDNSRTVFYKEMANEVDRGYVSDFDWHQLVLAKNDMKI